MKIQTTFSFTISLMFTMLTAGCNMSGNANDTLVMDLDAIAKATGQADTITQQIQAANQDLQGQLEAISQQLNEQLASEREKLGKKPSKKEQEGLKQLTLAAQQKMQQARTLAAQKSQQYKNALIIQLRQQVAPIAEKIARDKGASVVMITTPSMMWYAPEADITAGIIAELRAQKPVETTTDTVASESSAETTE